MADINTQAFRTLNLMAGTARSLNSESISPDDAAVWDRDFEVLTKDLKMVDPELAADLANEKNFYTQALQVAKGYFDAKEFGGLKTATGQFGFRLIAPQDLKQAASDASTPAYYSWLQTVTTSSGKTYKQYAFGYSSGKVYSSNEANKKEVMAFHRLLSYKPSPKLIYVEWSVNDYPYVPYCVEPYSKITKAEKLFRLIPMPGRMIIHPGGGFYTHLYFDRETGATAPSGTANFDVEVALFGLVFGEHDYLDATELT
jgi:hypothetical protein